MFIRDFCLAKEQGFEPWSSVLETEMLDHCTIPSIFLCRGRRLELRVSLAWLAVPLYSDAQIPRQKDVW